MVPVVAARRFAPLPPGDRALIQIVEAALAQAARKSGEWLACRPGCHQCCVGPFAINSLDAARLRQGRETIEKLDPARGASIRQRARESVVRLSPDFPGDLSTGLLYDGEEAQERFAQFANDEPCPALDPGSGLCDLYEFRPMTCRVFGPPVRGEEGLGVCELCYHGASDEEISACEMIPDPDGLEADLLRKMQETGGTPGETIVAFCLAS